MAYNFKDVFYLDGYINTGTGTGEGVKNFDVSSYVQPIAKTSRQKGTGLAIYKIHWSISDDGSNGPVASASTGTFRTALSSTSKYATAAVGSATLGSESLNNTNELLMGGMDFFGGGTAAGDPAPNTWLEPSPDVPYILVRDNFALLAAVTVAMSADTIISFRLECAMLALDQSVLNQLLRTQTV